jgi:hypothetical protein
MKETIARMIYTLCGVCVAGILIAFKYNQIICSKGGSSQLTEIQLVLSRIYNNHMEYDHVSCVCNIQNNHMEYDHVSCVCNLQNNHIEYDHVSGV